MRLILEYGVADIFMTIWIFKTASEHAKIKLEEILFTIKGNRLIGYNIVYLISIRK